MQVSPERRKRTIRAARNLFGCILTCAALMGCGGRMEKGNPLVLLSLDNYTAWRQVCESLASGKNRNVKPRATTFMGLADELSGSEGAVARECLANKMSVDDFRTICRAVGVGYSVLRAEEIDQKSAQQPAEDMVPHTCSDFHDPEFEGPPPAALAPREPPPPIIQEDTDETVAENVAFLRPFRAEVDRLAARLLGRSADEL